VLLSTVISATKNGKNIRATTAPLKKPAPTKDTLGAIELTKQARELLKEGKTEEAKAKFAQAREWNANVVFGDEGLE